jgi:hypothetical protein
LMNSKSWRRKMSVLVQLAIVWHTSTVNMPKPINFYFLIHYFICTNQAHIRRLSLLSWSGSLRKRSLKESTVHTPCISPSFRALIQNRSISFLKEFKNKKSTYAFHERKKRFSGVDHLGTWAQWSQAPSLLANAQSPAANIYAPVSPYMIYG